MTWLRVDKYERPHRSGILAIIVAYAALVLASAPFHYTGSNGVPSLLCTLVPFSPECWYFRHEKFTQQRVYETTKLVFCPQCLVVKEQKDCYWEIHESNSGEELPPYYSSVIRGFDCERLLTNPFYMGMRMTDQAGNRFTAYLRKGRIPK